MNINWFKNQNNVVYADTRKFVSNFEKESGISDLYSKIENFKNNPKVEGEILTGKKKPV